jgi:hypothetical protein
VYSGDSLWSAGVYVCVCVCVCFRTDQIYNKIDVSDDCKLEIGVIVLEIQAAA